MTELLPNTTGSQYFRVRTMPTASTGATLDLRLNLLNEDKNKRQTVSGSYLDFHYDSYDFLCVTASFVPVLTSNMFYNLEIEQWSGSVFCQTIYRGEILPTTQSATVRDSVPMFSYIDTDNQYIIYEY
jgi:hypothetical protein